ncbi:activator 1 37 kDa subunit [Histoplasma mississippiense (nom. inval.)]|uniref:activator 1 37 kDa subunit n=1 Tax=Ajellomyces capsulatus (strain NAm1 / WU24) TaxID=2059318 RepID=UPI000157C1A1|nr:activator 1 37 kDa subunit [Histoplasma mississippiense (nom. inval.)]EDN07794.1 activator 1 37 kDa subunit [Histoplasma mississippiense (nom. inval.)]
MPKLPHMLFYGPPGTGKTSTILALAKSLYGPQLYRSRILELNASDERGISIVREKIKDFARMQLSHPPLSDSAYREKYPCPPFKIIILDEADSMTQDAQSALRRTMERYSRITRFCLSAARLVGSTEGTKPGGKDESGDTEMVDAGEDGVITVKTIEEIAGVVPDDVVDRLIKALQPKKGRSSYEAVSQVVTDIVADGWSASQMLTQCSTTPYRTSTKTASSWYSPSLISG